MDDEILNHEIYDNKLSRFQRDTDKWIEEIEAECNEVEVANEAEVIKVAQVTDEPELLKS